MTTNEESLADTEPSVVNEKALLDAIVCHVASRTTLGDSAALNLIEDLIVNHYEEE